MATRRVVVDDTNSGIRYTGSWFQANGQNDNLGNFGPPFQRTSHGVNEDASLSYTFTGSSVQVLGTSKVSTTASGATDPSWECFVDNVSIGSKAPIMFPENNWVFCEAGSLSDGQHTVTLRATVSQNTFWFDRILYSPSSSVNLDSSLIMVDAGDSAVHYSSGWQDMRDIGQLTLQGGAKVTVDFSGTSLKWFSLIPGDMPHASTSATYSVDGGNPVTFFLAGLAAGAMEPYNQLFFEASGLSAGQHRIEVVHGGNSQTTPLSLNYMVIQNAPAPAGSTPAVLASLSSSSTSSSPSRVSSDNSTRSTTYNSLSPTGFPVTGSVTGSFSSSTPAPSGSSGASGSNSSFSQEHKGASTGAIAGGAVGGVVVLVAVILLLLLLRRRRKRKVNPELDQERDSPNIIEPFNSPPTAPVSFPTGGQLSSHSPMLSGPSGSKSNQMSQYPSQSTITGTPRPSRSHGSQYSSSQASESPANQGSTPGNSTSQLLGSNKAREAGELGDLPSTSQPSIPVASTSHSANTSTSQRVMRHEDSGVRLPPRESMLELPPLYTAS